MNVAILTSNLMSVTRSFCCKQGALPTELILFPKKEANPLPYLIIRYLYLALLTNFSADCHNGALNVCLKPR